VARGSRRARSADALVRRAGQRPALLRAGARAARPPAGLVGNGKLNGKLNGKALRLLRFLGR